MNAKLTLVAAFVSGCAVSVAVANAQDLVESNLASQLAKADQERDQQRMAELIEKYGREFECRFTFAAGFNGVPVRIKAADMAGAKRDAMALATPAAATCIEVATSKP